MYECRECYEDPDIAAGTIKQFCKACNTQVSPEAAHALQAVARRSPQVHGQVARLLPVWAPARVCPTDPLKTGLRPGRRQGKGWSPSRASLSLARALLC